jgi:hypothetical protein
LNRLYSYHNNMSGSIPPGNLALGIWRV